MLGIDRHQELGDLGAALFRHPHVEIDGKMQRLQLVAPRETEMVVAPPPGN
jgi:hypothetical protein